jgi:hypothetical protein
MDGKVQKGDYRKSTAKTGMSPGRKKRMTGAGVPGLLQAKREGGAMRRSTTIGRLVALSVTLVLAACVLGDKGGEAKMIGQPESALYATLGTPDRQITAPSGAMVDVYEARSVNGQNVLCNVSYFVRDGKIVGYSERGTAFNCGGSGGMID